MKVYTSGVCDVHLGRATAHRPALPLIRRMGRRPSSRRPVPAVSRRASRPAAAPVPCEEPLDVNVPHAAQPQVPCIVRRVRGARVCAMDQIRARAAVGPRRAAVPGGATTGAYFSRFRVVLSSCARPRRPTSARTAATCSPRPDPAPTPAQWLREGKCTVLCVYGPERDPKLEGL